MNNANDITNALLAGLHLADLRFVVWIAIVVLLIMFVPLTLMELRGARRTQRLDKLNSQSLLKGLGDLSALRRR